MTQPAQALDLLLQGAQRAQKQREAAKESGKIIAADREAERLEKERPNGTQS